MEQKPTKGIAVDGSCLGNPGSGEYRGVDIETGKELFRHKFSHTTNNVMEFCAIVHGLKYRKENRLDLQIYSDSQSAISWTYKKNCNSNLEITPKTEVMHQFIKNCEAWLLNNTKNSIPVSKWNTIEWGSVPADFGRKKSFIVSTELKAWVTKELSNPLISPTNEALLKQIITDFKL